MLKEHCRFSLSADGLDNLQNVVPGFNTRLNFGDNLNVPDIIPDVRRIKIHCFHIS